MCVPHYIPSSSRKGTMSYSSYLYSAYRKAWLTLTLRCLLNEIMNECIVKSPIMRWQLPPLLILISFPEESILRISSVLWELFANHLIQLSFPFDGLQVLLEVVLETGISTIFDKTLYFGVKSKGDLIWRTRQGLRDWPFDCGSLILWPWTDLLPYLVLFPSL